MYSPGLSSPAVSPRPVCGCLPSACHRDPSWLSWALRSARAIATFRDTAGSALSVRDRVPSPPLLLSPELGLPPGLAHAMMERADDFYMMGVHALLVAVRHRQHKRVRGILQMGGPIVKRIDCILPAGSTGGRDHDEAGNTMLVVATMCAIACPGDQNCLEVCRALLEVGKADVNMLTSVGQTSLLIAAYHGHLKLCRLLVIEAKANVNKAGGGSWNKTPLFFAAKKGHLEVCRLLLAEGQADVNKADITGITPLHVATLEGHQDVCRLLLIEGKADVNCADSRGTPPWWLPLQTGNVDLSRVLLLESQINLDQRTDGLKGKTPLHMAAGLGHLDLCRMLISEGTLDVNTTDSIRGMTPLFLATNADDVKICRLLIEEGHADVDKADISGHTPLHVATARGNKAIIRLLLKHKALELPDNAGHTPTQLAELIHRGPAGHKTCAKMSEQEQTEYASAAKRGVAYLARKRCEWCGGHFDSLKACGRCRTASYCSRSCQQQHWKMHKVNCKTPENQ